MVQAIAFPFHIENKSGRDRRFLRQAATGGEGGSGWQAGQGSAVRQESGQRRRGQDRQTSRDQRFIRKTATRGEGGSGQQTARDRRFVKQAARGGEGGIGWGIWRGTGGSSGRRLAGGEGGSGWGTESWIDGRPGWRAGAGVRRAGSGGLSGKRPGETNGEQAQLSE